MKGDKKKNMYANISPVRFHFSVFIKLEIDDNTKIVSFHMSSYLIGFL